MLSASVDNQLKQILPFPVGAVVADDFSAMYFAVFTKKVVV
jgi:hypothetical protein